MLELNWFEDAENYLREMRVTKWMWTANNRDEEPFAVKGVRGKKCNEELYFLRYCNILSRD
jgi:hypothetical protein